MTSTPLITRIEANPNPRSFRGRIRTCLNTLRHLQRDAAIDSARNVLALLGAGTVLGDFASMRLWMLLPGAAFLCLVWALDYVRHF